LIFGRVTVTTDSMLQSPNSFWSIGCYNDFQNGGRLRCWICWLFRA